MDFMRQDTNFIQTNNCSMQLLGDDRNIPTLDLGQNLTLKNLEKILEGIDDVARHEEDLIQN